MNLEHYLLRLQEMDPDMVVDELGITSEELVKKFHNKAAKKYYEEQEDDEGEDSVD